MVSVSITALPLATVQPNGNICNDSANGSVIDFYNYILEGSTNGSWSDTDNSGSSGLFTAREFSGVAPGNYTFTYNIPDNGPCGAQIYTIELLVEDCSCPSVAINSPNDVCNNGFSIDLNTLLITTELGSWSITNTPTGSSSAVIMGNVLSYNNSDPGTYELSFTLIEEPPTGCPSSNQVVLEIFDAPNAGDDMIETSCLGGTINLNNYLSLSAAINGQWIANGPFGASLMGSSFNTNDIIPGDYYFDYLVSGSGACDNDISTLTLSLEDCGCTPLYAEINENITEICADEINTLDLNGYLTSNSDFLGSWSLSNQVINNGIWNYNNQTGIQYFDYTINPPTTDPVECESLSLVLPITIIPKFEIQSTEILCNDIDSESSINLNDLVISTGLSGSWMAINDGSTSGLIPELDFMGSLEGIYEYQYVLDVEDGCNTSSHAVQIQTEQCSNKNLYAPSAFSPNGDGKNDVFRLVGNDYIALEISIYDRWGKLLFRSVDNNAGWDGSYNGLACELGVYVYYAQVVRTNGVRELIQGNITLIK